MPAHNAEQLGRGGHDADEADADDADGGDDRQDRDSFLILTTEIAILSDLWTLNSNNDWSGGSEKGGISGELEQLPTDCFWPRISLLSSFDLS